MRLKLDNVSWTIKTPVWCLIAVLATLAVIGVSGLSGPNVCMVKQKYNITKRVKYRAPMSVRTYEWCFAMPPRCSKWTTEMRDLTRLETEERTAEMAICCPGYKMKDISCVPICPNGKTGHGCSEDCPQNKWGPNCVHECKRCKNGICSPFTGECVCQDGWQGESCDTIVPTTPAAMMEQILTSVKTTASTKIPTLSTTTSSTTNTTIIKVPVETSTVPSTPTTSLKTSPTSITTAVVPSTTLPAILSSQNRTTVTITSTFNPSTETSKNMSLGNSSDKELYKPISEEKTQIYLVRSANFNNTRSTHEAKILHTTVKTDLTTELAIAKSTSTQSTSATTTIARTKPSTALRFDITESTSKLQPTTENIITSTIKLTDKMSLRPETTRKLDVTAKQSTTAKFKPKEIWIRPAQKGESFLVESKMKTSQEAHVKSRTKEITEVTTPRTIIVSIIPTSVSYTSFKKIALTTILHSSQRENASIKYSNTRPYNQDHTKPMTMRTTTSMPATKNIHSRRTTLSTTVNPLFQNITAAKSYPSFTTKTTFKATTLPEAQTTNSMTSTWNVVSKKLKSYLLTTSFSSTNATSTVKNRDVTPEIFIYTTSDTNAQIETKTSTTSSTKATKKHYPVNKQHVTADLKSVTVSPITSRVIEVTKKFVGKQADTNISKQNLTTPNTEANTVTEDPTKDEEIFHILTEPEHITAVMSDKGTDRSSLDLISVISIAGGVMMAVITVAVIIVMIERCRKPRYEDVRKYNDIRMQVMIDNNDVPPPYVRSIFHTPLPEPPASEKCHYQPISTLDRNLKQFMRPVVVQTISPLMLENFRGILECHYDHLPRRSHDLGTMEARCSIPPSVDERVELLPQRVHSLTDSDIEAMKCEARLDVIDNTTSEPLYAEIPCWRPPSEHAVEIVNLNGEAVTEL